MVPQECARFLHRAPLEITGHHSKLPGTSSELPGTTPACLGSSHYNTLLLLAARWVFFLSFSLVFSFCLFLCVFVFSCNRFSCCFVFVCVVVDMCCMLLLFFRFVFVPNYVRNNVPNNVLGSYRRSSEQCSGVMDICSEHSI